MKNARRNLVIVRAGDSSLHPRWLQGAEGRSWDLLVNYFGDDPDKYRDQDVIRIDGKGPKWPALKEVIEANRDLVDRYDYIWLPDDDIDCRGSDIDRMFEIARRHNLALCQPALTVKSYFSWGVTLRNPFTRLRFTNFVEIMVPCFDHDFLLRCLPTMGANLSGFGLDFVWPKMLEATPERIAIIDEVAVTHTRPVGGPNYKLLREQGITAHDEGRALRQKHGINDITVYVNSVITAGGIRLEGRSRVARFLLRGAYRLAIAQAYALRQPNRWDLSKALGPQLAFPDRYVTDWL
jgi:hypothetical protein